MVGNVQCHTRQYRRPRQRKTKPQPALGFRTYKRRSDGKIVFAKQLLRDQLLPSPEDERPFQPFYPAKRGDYIIAETKELIPQQQFEREYIRVREAK